MRGLGGKSRVSDDGPKHRRNKTDLGFHLLVEGVLAQNFQKLENYILIIGWVRLPVTEGGLAFGFSYA